MLIDILLSSLSMFHIIVTHHGQSFKAPLAYQTCTREASAANASGFLLTAVSNARRIGLLTSTFLAQARLRYSSSVIWELTNLQLRGSQVSPLTKAAPFEPQTALSTSIRSLT